MANVRPSDQISLRTKFGGGYEKAQVDELVAKLHGEISQLTGEVNRLSNDLKAAHMQAAQMKAQAERLAPKESAISEALITAQKAAEEVRNNAEQHANTLVQEAQQRAEATVEEARQRAEDTVKSYEDKINDLKWDLERLRIERDKFVKDFRILLENHLRELTEETVAVSNNVPPVAAAAVVQVGVVSQPATDESQSSEINAEDFISG